MLRPGAGQLLLLLLLVWVWVLAAWTCHVEHTPHCWG